MLILECVEPIRKIKGSWSAGGQNGLLPIVRPQSRQGFLGTMSLQVVPYLDKVSRPGTRPCMGARDKPARAARTRTRQCSSRAI